MGLLSIYDLLLMNEPVTTTTVRNDDMFQKYMQKGQFIVWRFTTANYDIGFSVELNNEVRLGYARHRSHEKPICGSLEASCKGTCKLIWDNSYAKCKKIFLPIFF